jgi:hypothetical protein
MKEKGYDINEGKYESKDESNLVLLLGTKNKGYDV